MDIIIAIFVIHIKICKLDVFISFITADGNVRNVKEFIHHLLILAWIVTTT